MGIGGEHVEGVSCLKVDGTLGEYTATLTDVDPNQKYSFRAYAINVEGTSYGEVMTFTTTAGLPSLSATGVTDITTTSAKFTSTVVSNEDFMRYLSIWGGEYEWIDINPETEE